MEKLQRSLLEDFTRRKLYHPTAIHYRINSPNPQTGKNYRK
uniref:Uncharacterized protein n=1 Tax=Amphidinium carterae TaxID=2961 RepID=A7YXH5_AMPCA|nr:unknown [Amphidinium carterae]